MFKNVYFFQITIRSAPIEADFEGDFDEKPVVNSDNSAAMPPTLLDKKINKLLNKLLLVSRYQRIYRNAMTKTFNESSHDHKDFTNTISSLPFEIIGSLVGLMMGALTQFQQRFHYQNRSEMFMNDTLTDLMK